MILSKSKCLLAAWLCGLVLTGCGPAPREPVEIPAAPAATGPMDYSPLTEVLQAAVNDRGFVVEAELENVQDRLDAQLARMTAAGPTATPERFADADRRLAYWYNARAAWSIKLVQLGGFEAVLPREQFERRRFRLDGRTLSLAEIDDLLGRDEDWQVVVAAPCARLYRAALPAEAFSGGTIRGAIGRRFNEYLDDPERFVISVPEQTIYFHPVLWSLRGRLIAEYRRTFGTTGATLNTALLRFVSGSAMRRLQDAIGYAERPLAGPGRLAVVPEEE